VCVELTGQSLEEYMSILVYTTTTKPVYELLGHSGGVSSNVKEVTCVITGPVKEKWGRLHIFEQMQHKKHCRMRTMLADISWEPLAPRGPV
jgi:hypothetical protein